MPGKRFFNRKSAELRRVYRKFISILAERRYRVLLSAFDWSAEDVPFIVIFPAAAFSADVVFSLELREDREISVYMPYLFQSAV